MKPATTLADNGAFSVQKSIFGPECITIRLKPQKSILNSPYGPEKSPFPALSRRSFMKYPGYSVLQKSVAKSRVLENAIDSRMRIKTTTCSDVQQKTCQFYWHGLLHVTIENCKILCAFVHLHYFHLALFLG
jgi:hypothetical protein